MTQPGSDAAVVDASVGEVVRDSERLGLTWTVTPGTVDASGLAVITDGDSVSIGVFSLVGPLMPYRRVMVMIVTNGGNYVIGYIDDSRLYRYKSEDETVVNNTALQDDNDLFVNLAPRRHYSGLFAGIWIGNSGGDFRYAFSFPTGATVSLTHMAATVALGAGTDQGDGNWGARRPDTTSPTGELFGGTTDTTNPTSSLCKITIITTASGGQFRLRWAQFAVNATPTTLCAGSTLELNVVG